MKANGLMVGNYIMNEGVVAKIDARSIFDMFNDNPKYKPISLTEKWLLRFGFRVLSDGCETGIKLFAKDELYRIAIYKDGTVTIEIYCDTEHREYFRVIAVANYVHTFQNAWFALTGEELEITQ